MPGWLIPAGIQAGASVLGYLARRKRRTPEFGSTAHGKYLRKIREQGMYSPTAKAGILGEVGKQAGNIEHQERTRIRGYLESIGAGKSISGGKLLSSPGMERLRSVSGEAGKLERQNELSKVTAGEEFARRKTEHRRIRSGEKSEEVGGLVGGLAGAGMSAYGAFQAKEAGIPYAHGLDESATDILRAKIMYGEDPTSMLPEGWENFEYDQLEYLSRKLGIPLDDLMGLRDMKLFEKIR